MNRTGVRILLLVVAIILFVVAGLGYAGWLITFKNPNDGLACIGFGLAFFAGAHLP